ncbi:MAG: hypothetical protein ABIA59_09325 [Candidatus Latescibacterota bacterium]
MKRRLIPIIVAAFTISSVMGVTVAEEACIGIPDLEYSTVTTQGGLLLTCPAGDGPSLSDIGGRISITVRSMCPEWSEPLPIPVIPATDIWLWSEGVLLCGGSSSANADGPTDSQGMTTISGPVASGGYAETVHVVVMGVLLGEMTGLSVVSPDIDRDLLVNLGDLAEFASAFFGLYDPRADMDGNGLINLTDFVLFAGHWQHACD